MDNLNSRVEKLDKDFSKFSEDVGGLVIGLTKELKRVNSELIDIKNCMKNNKEVGQC